MRNYAQRTRIKVCGITRIEDALNAADSGIDALGFVFYENSPRYINQREAARIVKSLPPFISRVALFVNASNETIRSTLSTVSVDTLQFHGEETPGLCRSYGLPYIKSIRMNHDVNLHQLSEDYHDASALLLDSFVEGAYGGTGQKFEWSMIPQDLNKRIILAGGLTVHDVADAISKVSPYAVDVSSGVETEKGIKNAEKITEFTHEVMCA